MNKLDDLAGRVCTERSIWLHVDGCHGVFAPLSPLHRSRRGRGTHLPFHSRVVR